MGGTNGGLGSGPSGSGFGSGSGLISIKAKKNLPGKPCKKVILKTITIKRVFPKLSH